MSRKKKKDDGYIYFQEITIDGLVDIEPKKIARKERKLKEYPPKENHLYQYKGQVKQFGKCVISNFSAATRAPSEAKAKQNIIFQAKKYLGLHPYAGGFKLVNELVRLD